MTFTFTHSGPGRVHCDGDPPLTLRIGDVEHPCSDPMARCCTWQPAWTPGVERVVCVNAAGDGPVTLVNVPEVDLLPGLAIGLLCAGFMAWLTKGAR